MTSVRPLRASTRRRATSTSNFGVGRRESHDASAFYARFARPVTSSDDEVAPHRTRDRIWVGDAREMDRHGKIADKSVALVVTSPPYFAGKEYEQALGSGHVPADYGEYLGMVHDVFEQCRAKLEPGGRIAVNVANLGRKPYRSLSRDVIDILEQLGFLLRGEIIWQKSAAAGGSCAWGTYQRPGNPVLRDVTERVVVASKGRFDRALTAGARLARDLPNEGSMPMDDFVDATTDLWQIPAESATRVGHPAPFPVELARRLIELYTYRDDLVLDPFMGSGSTAVAAVRTERHFVGFDTDAGYVARATERVAAAQAERAADRGRTSRRVVVPPRGGGRTAAERPASYAASVRRGQKARELARQAIETAGFAQLEADVTVADLGVEVAFRAVDGRGGTWLFDVCGAFSSTRPGLRQAEVLWRALGKASVLQLARQARPDRTDLGPLVLLTTEVPDPGSLGGRALATARGAGAAGTVCDVVELLERRDLLRLKRLARSGPPRPP